MGLILALKKAKISPFFEGSVVQNLIKHQEEKIIFQQNVFYFVKLFESSLKIYFGPLGTSWGLRNHFGSQKELKKVQTYTDRAFSGGVGGSTVEGGWLAAGWENPKKRANIFFFL
jgi:hypothetical protein